MTLPICLVDVDGVLADMNNGLAKAFGRQDLVDNWPAGLSCEKALGINRHDMWAHVDAIPGFWAGLELYPWAYKLLDAIEDAGYQPIICTTPREAADGIGFQPACVAEKLAWLAADPCLAELQCVLTSDKALLAAPGRLMVDDWDENIRRFSAAGGTAILFPRPWNRLNGTADALGYVRHVLRGLKP